LRPVIVVAVLIRMIDVFKVYDTIYALFGTGVGVRILNVHLTTYIFRTHDYGEGSALSVVILLLVSIIVPVFFKLTSKAEEIRKL
jgi:multiple sugar transport system permease protein